jgi:uncharacterized protein
MAPFTCTACGKCCMGFGDYIRVERQINEHNFVCRLTLTNELFSPRVEFSYRELYADTSQRAENPRWCMFLRKSPETERYVCTVYPTRPGFCRSFVCCRMRIVGSDGTILGSVKGRRSLSTEDDGLRQYWSERVAPLAIDDDAAWQEQVRALLAETGYGVEIYE